MHALNIACGSHRSGTSMGRHRANGSPAGIPALTMRNGRAAGDASWRLAWSRRKSLKRAPNRRRAERTCRALRGDGVPARAAPRAPDEAAAEVQAWATASLRATITLLVTRACRVTRGAAASSSDHGVFFSPTPTLMRIKNPSTANVR